MTKMANRKLNNRQKMIMLIITTLTVFAMMGMAASHVRPHYFINASSSLPYGIYHIKKPSGFNKGDIVVFNPPKAAADLIHERQWLPKGWPLLKHIGAVAGETYCVKPQADKSYHLYINNQYTGPVHEKDSQGLPIIHITGCHVVGRDHFLPVSTYINNSFDGRYFGAVPLTSIRGVAEPLITF